MAPASAAQDHGHPVWLCEAPRRPLRRQLRKFLHQRARIPLGDRASFSLDNPSDEVLRLLSVGVGVPADRLRALRRETAFARATAEIERILREQPEYEQLYANALTLPND